MTRFLPGIVLGLFLARVAGEIAGLPGLWAAMLLSVILAALFGWLLGSWAIAATWPALLLLLYLPSQEVNLERAAAVAAIALVAAVLSRQDAPQAQPAAATAILRAPATVAISLLVGVAFFSLYVLTLAPDVLPADSGELQVVAANLGVAHPPGFPLYVVLAHLMTRLPFASPAYAVNLLSAVTSASALVLVYWTGLLLTRRQAAALLAVVALGTATTYWSQATTTNVRSLTALFAGLMIFAAVRFRIAMKEAPEPDAKRQADRWLVLLAVAAGFGLSHHVSLVFLALICLVFVVISDPSLLRTPRRWLWPILGALLGLLPLIYLPLRVGSGARGATPELATVGGFLEHVLAVGFRGDLFYYIEPADFWARLGTMGNVLAFQFLPVLLAGMVAGLLLLLWRDRPLALLLGGSVAIYVVVAATYRAPQTVEYMMPAYIPAVLILGYVAGRLLALPDAAPAWTRALGRAAVALWFVGAAVQGYLHYGSYAFLHRDSSTRDYVSTVIEGSPAGATILAHWHWVTPLWYLQEVEGLRPDVDIRFVFPEGEPYDDTWAKRIEESVTGGRPTVSTYTADVGAGPLPVAEPLGEAVVYSGEVRDALPDTYESLPIVLSDRLAIQGYRLNQETVTPGDEFAVELAWQPLGDAPEGLTLFVHLVGSDGRLYAQHDQGVEAKAQGLTLTQFRLTPRLDIPPGAAELFVGAYATEALPDASGAERSPFASVEATPITGRWYTGQRTNRLLLDDPSHRRLAGYDWDYTLPGLTRLYLHWQTDDGYLTETVDNATAEPPVLPTYRGPWGVPQAEWAFEAVAETSYVPFGEGIVWTGDLLDAEARPSMGDMLTMTHALRSTRPVTRDYVVSNRLIGLEDDGFHWDWWDLVDSVPAMGAIPTLKWIENSAVRSPHRVTVAAEAESGQQLTGALTIYDAFTKRPLPILDERITADFAWVPLGGAQVGDQ